MFNFNKSTETEGVPTHRNEKQFCYNEMEIERKKEERRY